MDDTNYIKESEEGDVDNNYHLESYLELTKSFENPEQEIFASFSSHSSIDDQFEKQNQYNTHIDEDEHNYELDLNYKSPINEQSNFEIGYDGRFLNSEESMDFALEGLNGVNDFNMKRHIHGFFGEYQLEKKYDGHFFQQGAPFNQGNIFDFNEDDFISACEEAIKRVESNKVNIKGTELKEQFNYKNTVDKIELVLDNM